MKKLIYLILVGWIVSINAQGITNTLGGNTSADKFVVENSDAEAGLVVTGEGMVGIGTNNPTVNLHISDDSAELLRLQSTSGADPQISFYQDATPTAFIQSWGDHFYLLNSQSGNLYFGTNNTEMLTINSDGNVGIGTVHPVYKLDIVGPANLNKNSTGTFLRANSIEAAWFNGDYFSWGYGGNHNYFADPVQVGYTGFAPTYQFEATVNDGFGYIAEFRNSNTGVNADGVRIRLGPNANPGSSNGFLRFWDGDDTYLGGINGDGSGGVSYVTVSDARLKMNIIDYPSALDKVSKIRVRQYEMKSAPGNQQIGFLAQELQNIYPQAVGGDPEGDVNREPMGIDYGRLTPLLVRAIQELQARVEELENR